MFARIAGFEFRYQLRNPVFLAAALVLFLMAFAGMLAEDLSFSTDGNVHENAPVSIAGAHLLFSLLSLFVPAAFVSNVVVRDEQTGFGALIRATRVRKFDYLMGRFTGATLAAALALLAVPLALWLGTSAPGIAPETLGPNRLSDYAFSYFLLALPNTFLASAAFFALATLTRSTLGTFLGLIAFLFLYSASAALMSPLPELRELLAVLDPFGVAAFTEVTRYWTPAESNARMPPLQGVLLWNRLLWVVLSLSFLVLAYVTFSFSPRVTPGRRRGSATPAESDGTAQPLPRGRGVRLPWPDFGRATARAQLIARTRLELTQVFRSPGFPILLLMGLAVSGVLLSTAGKLYGTPTLPVTRHMVLWLSAVFNVVSIVIAVYYAGELVWRDRESRFHEFLDASPLPSWGHVIPKALATYLVLLTTMLAGVVAAIAIQLSRGYTDLELHKYLFWYILPTSVDTMLIAVLAVFVQALSPNKFVGWGVMLLYFVCLSVAGELGLESPLSLYGQTPTVAYSDMNGLGSFWVGAWVFRVYWAAFAILLLVGAHLLWRRGAETRLRPRLRRVPAGLRGTTGALAAGALAVFVAAGGYAFYNTIILDDSLRGAEAERFLAEYERRFLPYASLPQPSITDVELDVALYPGEARAVTRGSYTLRNLTGQPLRHVHVRNPAPELEIASLEFSGARLESHDEAFGYRIYQLEPELAPGDSRQLRFETRRRPRGFRNARQHLRLVENGTFLDSRALLPAIGMSRVGLLEEPATRRKYGLPPELRPARLEDDSATARNQLGASWATADITVSTAAGQTPMAPGRRVSDEEKEGRRTARFVSQTPILSVFSIQSARYAEEHRRADGVDLAVYFHPEHRWNVDRMLDALEASLAYYVPAFGPSRFDEVRITEFPAYALAAQTFANTIPYSEAAGFVADLSGSEGIDYVTYLTAHEVAHQWWGHQVIGADVQGGSMLSETLAQYSALMVMKRLHGEHEVRRFLRFELERYLSGRGKGKVGELPLARVEDQPYIHYQKGSLAMYLLQERLGEERVNRALRRYLERFRSQGAPYPRSTDLIALLREEASTPEQQALMTDLFERITLYELQVREPRAVQRADGRWEVSVPVEARKFYAEADGTEAEAELDERIEVGLFTADPRTRAFAPSDVVLFEQRPVRSGRQVLHFVTDQRPTHAGVDPYHYRIDRNSGDNVTAIEH